MPLRPGRCYSKLDTMPYTRKEYIAGFPPPKITKYDYGNVRKKFPIRLELYAEEDGLIRHNALDASRIIATKTIEERVGLENYHLKVVKYPFHVIRENKMLAMAGADRLQEGMRLSFGKPIGTAAIVRKGDKILYLECGKEALELAKTALKRAASKLPIKTRMKLVEQ
ncbi:MAG TPA: 50S ribosomal protein L16 [Geobacterales bacterium]|nr:50S ribosomal protein L16 [Geobacterales bacterium]